MSPNGNFTKFSIASSMPVGNSYSNSSEQGGAITVGPDGNLWLVQGDEKIERITPKGTITEFPLSTAAYFEPDSITAGPDGNLWVTYQISNEIGRISTSGAVTLFPLPPSLSAPDGIMAGPDGNLWFTLGGGQDQIGRITPNGIITIFSFPGTLGSAIDSLTVGPHGNIWFTNANDNIIGRFNPTNPEQTVIKFPLPASDNGSPGHPGGTPVGIIMGPDGNIWFTEFYGPKIGRIDTNGTIIEFLLPTVVEEPATIIVGPDHNLWFTEGNTYKIGHITIGK
jgi:streptogramin lyase